jgi:hypothetical protein
MGRFTGVDPLLASAKVARPESWNRYSYCYNNPLTLIDPSGMDVQLLDEKAKERVLNTLPANIRKQVAAQIGKDGLLKKGALDKIKSKDQNFADLREMVNGKGTVEVLTTPKNERGVEFDYQSVDELKAEAAENLRQAGASQDEIDEALKEITNPNVSDGRTLDANESPTGNIRVMLADGTGKTADEPALRLVQTAAHELYGHAYLAQKGQPWKHDDGGPVNQRIIQVEERTKKNFPTPPPVSRPRVKKP